MTPEIAHERARLADIQRFYASLERLASLAGGARLFSHCTGSQRWPRRGVYFIFEPREARRESGTAPRVVRIGTHALKGGSKSTLWGRLSQHRGTQNPAGGNHRGSIFRLLIGLALAGRNSSLASPSWGVGSNAPSGVREGERHLESLVSRTIGAMSVTWLAIDDDAAPTSLRGYIERNAIALLSNFGKPAVDSPSPGWLGSYCPRERVVRSGLWNNNHVEETYEPDFLDRFDCLIEEMGSHH